MPSRFDPPDLTTVPRTIERRRHQRIVPGPHTTVLVPHVIQAEVLDLSATGAFLSASASLAEGQRAHLRMLLSSEPFSAWVEVVRAASPDASGAHRLGVRFTVIDAQSQVALQRFVRDASPQVAR